MNCVEILGLKIFMRRLSHELQVEYFEIVTLQIVKPAAQVDYSLELSKDDAVVSAVTKSVK